MRKKVELTENAEMLVDANIQMPNAAKNVLGALIYTRGAYTEHRKENNDWFYKDADSLIEESQVSKKTFFRMINLLEANNFIERQSGSLKKGGNKVTQYKILKGVNNLSNDTNECQKQFNDTLIDTLKKQLLTHKNKELSIKNKELSIKNKEEIFNNIIKYYKNNNIINTGKSMREPNVELMNNLIKSIESINETLQLMNSSIKENSNKIEIINESLQLMNSTMNENFNKLINKIDSFLDSSDKVNDTEDTLGNDTNSSSESESVEEQSNLESESAEDEIKDDSNNESEPIEPETTNNNKPSTIEKEKEKGCAEREKETTEELPNGAIQFTTSVDLEKYVAKNKLSSLENWGKYKIDIDNLVIVPTEMTQEANKSNPEPSNDMDGIVDHTGENKPNLPISNEPTEDELKFEKRKQKAKELVSRLINEHMTNEQEFIEYFNKGFMWCKKFQLETYYVKLIEKYKPDVDTTEVEEEYALNDIFSNAA